MEWRRGSRGQRSRCYVPGDQRKALVLRGKPAEHDEQTGDVICFTISKDHSGCSVDNRWSGMGQGV